MSNKNESSTEIAKSVRWRMHFPGEILDAIIALSIAEERDPGEIVARWVKDYYRTRFSTGKEESSA